MARLIGRGDAARSRGDWQAAASAYQAALDIAPGLTHIRVQLGHARKESGDLEAAYAAYERASERAPADPDPRIHLGLAAKLLGRLPLANAHYLAALERAPDDLSVAIDALGTAPAGGPEREQVVARIARLLGDESGVAAQGPDRAPSHPICADVTDLLAYFGRARLPTGIQRVQIEAVMAIGEAYPDLATICCYSAPRGGWLAVEAARFLMLARMALASDDRGDPAWRRQVTTMHLALACAPLLRFAAGAVLLNLGTSWSERNYFLHVRAAREESGLAYVPMVYDCIPMFAPQWFPTALVRDYRAWMRGLFDAADGIIAISDATRADLLAVATSYGREATPEAIRVVAMDGDFRRIGRRPIGIDRLSAWGLSPETYVLMVSTIEPRKNHVGAFEAWLRLAERHGRGALPKLVCVGGRGWLNEPVHAMLRRHRLLRDKVVMLSGIADEDLDLLYRCARFTLYPSFYEGWGLPVTESLSHGRVPAISNGSSLPEAGGSFAIYFDPNDPVAIADAIEPLIFDDALRSRAETRIRADFRPRPWHKIAAELLAEARSLADGREAATVVPSAEPGILYALGSDLPLRDDIASGERFRSGWDWAPPSPDGNPIGEALSMLRMTIPDGAWQLRLRVSSTGSASCRIAAGEAQWHRDVDGSSSPAWIAAPLSAATTNVAEIGIGAVGPLVLEAFCVTSPDAAPHLVSGSAPA